MVDENIRHDHIAFCEFAFRLQRYIWLLLHVVYGNIWCAVYISPLIVMVKFFYLAKSRRGDMISWLCTFRHRIAIGSTLHMILLACLYLRVYFIQNERSMLHEPRWHTESRFSISGCHYRIVTLDMARFLLLRWYMTSKCWPVNMIYLHIPLMTF